MSDPVALHPPDTGPAGSNERPVDVFSALAFAYSECGYVRKTGAMTHGQRYTYASDADLIRGVRSAMAAAGLFGPYPVQIKRTDADHGPTRSGAAQYRVDVEVTYRVTHGASGTHLEVVSISRGIDSGDKAAFKAMTGAYKYAIRQLFCLEVGDRAEDPDTTSSTDQETATAKDTVKPTRKAEPDPGKREVVPHETWRATARPFLERLKELDVSFGVLSDECERLYKTRPSEWPPAHRTRLLADLYLGKFPKLYKRQIAPIEERRAEEHDADFTANGGAERRGFMAQLGRRDGLTYDRVRDHFLNLGDTKPSTWGRSGRARFLRDLDAHRIPALYLPTGFKPQPHTGEVGQRGRYDDSAIPF